MKKGGYRQGAGRKKGFAALQAEQARELFAITVAPHLKKIINALTKKAQSGDVSAARELFDRAWGKPQQKFETNDLRIQKVTTLAEIQDSMKKILSRP